MKRIAIPVLRTAQVEIRGDLSESTDFVWIVLHGYAQIASDFVEKFSDLQEDGRCFLAPEGLSKFYVKGAFGEVGASWMTKHDRADEIQDYIGYLSKVINYVRSSSPNAAIFILGFSQGAATAARFFMNRNPQDIQGLVLWGAVFPTDFTLPLLGQHELGKIILVYGTSDPYMPDNLAELFLDFRPKLWPFNGGHDLPPKVLREVILSLEGHGKQAAI